MKELIKYHFENIVDSICRHFRHLIRSIKWFYQRRTRGWDDREIWSLDMTLAKWLVPRLKLLKEKKHGIPILDSMGHFDIDTDFDKHEAEWNRIMDHMIRTFEIIAFTDDWELQFENEAFINKGLEYFRRHYFDLWD